MMRWLLILISSVTTITIVEATTRVTCYDQSNYGGSNWVIADYLEHFSYLSFGSLNDKLTSFRLDRGSCVLMDVDNPPSGENYWADSSVSNVGSTWDNRFSTVMSCGTATRDIQCPSGTFVKKIEWTDIYSLRLGIRLFCYEPRSKTPSATLYSHPFYNFTGYSEECTGIRGIQIAWDSQREVEYNLTPLCHPGQSSSHTIICPDNKAMSGMRFTIERYSNQIKTSDLYCKDVGDIESICEAHDEKQVLFVCDATEAVGEFVRCEGIKTVGIAKKTSMSESQTNEYTFYSEFGFDIRASGYGLSANFKATLGQSNTTGYNWETSQESTWEEEMALTVEIVASPGCKTTVSEIVGDCSFMEVRPFVFYRNDTCNYGRSIISEVTIPTDFSGKVFTSTVPIVMS